MTTATTEGRRLKLSVDGIDEAFLVDPIPSKRGKHLTNMFVLASLKAIGPEQIEQIFIEAIGPANYSRITGLYVDVRAQIPSTEPGVASTFESPSITYGPDGPISGSAAALAALLNKGALLEAREARDDEPILDGEPIRQEEAEELCLAAFYWQSVVGIEAVNAIFEEGGGTRGSLKALSLLQIRLGHSPSGNSLTPDMESSILQQAGSAATSDTPPSSGSVRLPANKVGFMQNARKTRKSRKRR